LKSIAFIDNQWIMCFVFPYTNLGYVGKLLYLCDKLNTTIFKSLYNMKKTIFSIAMCLIGMCSAYAISMPGTPIVFVDIYAVMPCDDAEDGDAGGRPDPTQQIIGGIDGNDLNIGIVDNGYDGDKDAGDVIVINPETGDIIVEEGFVGQTSVNIPEPGSYTAYVVVDGVTYAGDFEVE
jgi:hypothetical protein